MDFQAARVAEFLAQQTQRQFCVKCLVAELGSGLQDFHIRGALVTLSAEIALDRSAGECSACRGWNVVYGLFAPDAEGRPPSERLADFLQTSPGMVFCHGCLCRHLHMAHHVVRKAADRLRMAGTAQLQGGRCASCERLRLVIGHDVADEGGTLRPGIA